MYNLVMTLDKNSWAIPWVVFQKPKNLEWYVEFVLHKYL